MANHVFKRNWKDSKLTPRYRASRRISFKESDSSACLVHAWKRVTGHTVNTCHVTCWCAVNKRQCAMVSTPCRRHARVRICLMLTMDLIMVRFECKHIVCSFGKRESPKTRSAYISVVPGRCLLIYYGSFFLFPFQFLCLFVEIKQACLSINGLKCFVF